MESIDPVYARLIVRAIERSQADTSTLFSGISIGRNDLLRGGNIPMSDFLHVLREGQRLIGDDSLGLMLGSQASAVPFGALSGAMAVAPTIRQGLQVMDSFTRLHASYVRINARSRPSGMVLTMTYAQDPGDLRRFHSETALMVLQNYAESLWGQPLIGARFSMDYPKPEYASRYADYLHGEITFDSSVASVEIPRVCLDDYSPHYHPDEWQMTMGRLSQELKTIGSSDRTAYSSYVATILRTSEPPLPDLAQVARSLYVSERTLNRRLQLEQTSFRELKSAALHRWAELFLEQTDFSVDGIAARLGYQDTANFRRAFRKRVGYTPSEFRRRPKD